MFLVNNGETPILIRDPNRAQILVYTKIWYFFKLSLTYDILSDEFYEEYDMISLAPPFKSKARFSRRKEK